MSEYTMINKDGRECGTKSLTDAMADRLTARGWQLIPIDTTVQVQVIKFGR